MGASIEPSYISSRSMRMRTFKALVLATFVLGGRPARCRPSGRPLLSDDEAIYAVTADALGRGDLLYRDVVDHKPPLIYHVYQAGFAALGRYNTQGAHALVVLAVLLTAGFLFAIKRQEGRAGDLAPALRRRRPGGGGAVSGFLDDLARLRRAGGELRAVLAGAAGDRRLAAAAGSPRAARGARGIGDSSGGGRPDRNVGPVQVSGPHFSRRFDRSAALVGDPRTGFRRSGP